jgi:hypothetical protein
METVDLKRQTRSQALTHTSLAHAGGLTPTSWEPPQDLPLRDWIVAGARFGTIGKGVNWWIGDWLRFGNARFGERYTRARTITGYDVQTLMNMVYVASRFAPSERNPRLTWSHHAELAPLEPADRGAWLERAEQGRMSVRDLRQELRRAERGVQGRRRRRGAIDEGDAVVCPRCGSNISLADAADRDRLLAVR